MRLGELDTAGAIFARTHGHFEPAERVVGAFSRTGEHGACWVVLGLTGAAVDPERRNEWLRGVGAVITAYPPNSAIKLVVRRRRPEFEGLPPLTPTVSRLSFPSAHATTSFAAARALGRLIAPAPLYAVAL